MSALAEPVDPAFALFVAGRVPRQVVVDDSLEVFLQVHAFGQAVGRDEHRSPRFVAGQVPDPCLALVGGKHAGDGADRVGGAEALGQVLGDVFGGVDEPAEDHRVVSLEQQLRDHLGQQCELGIGFAFQGGGAARETLQPPAMRGVAFPGVAVRTWGGIR